MLSLIKSWKSLVIVGLFLGLIGGYQWHQWEVADYQDRIESLEQDKAELRADLEVNRRGEDKLRHKIDKQNDRIDDLKERNERLAQRRNKMVENAKDSRKEMRSQIESLRGQLKEGSTCKESIDWLIEKANKELK